MAVRSSSYEGPLYRQIADRLRERIASLESGTRIPSEPQLAKDWGVSRFTVSKAVEQLVDEGLITRRQGSGTFVATAPLRRAPGYLLSFTEAVEAAGHRATHRVLKFEPAPWQDSLPYPPGTALLLLDRLRLVDGIAVARHRSMISAELADKTGLTATAVAEAGFSLYRHFEDQGFAVSNATETLIACSASGEDRKLLGLTRDAGDVAVTRHSYTADGMPLDAVEAVYDARRYSYEARLVREHYSPDISNKERRNEDKTGIRRSHIGPRLGPWGN
jgi:GntR family transcriptional regulator